MKCLIIGYGSIGRRHANILKNLGCQVFLVTKQTVLDYICYPSIEEALTTNEINYTVISNPTHLHHQSLITLIQCNYKGVVLVEKPLFSTNESLPQNNIKKILVAYNLRFCDLLNKAKKIIADEEIITFSAYVGSYLPSWRNNIDYRDGYSAKKNQGGGVLRDLSHELDYCTWFCGRSLEVSALGGHFSNLEIDSDDVYSILMRSDTCSVINLHLNYLDRAPRREVIINTNQKTVTINLIKGTLSINGVELSHSPDRSQTYIEQHKALLSDKFSSFCTYEEGLYLMDLVKTIENANSTQKWIPL